MAFTFNLRFPGQYFDAETGLNYNYFRDYDPKTGRYVESDPIGLNGGLGTYTYVGDSPIRYMDVLGEDVLGCGPGGIECVWAEMQAMDSMGVPIPASLRQRALKAIIAAMAAEKAAESKDEAATSDSVCPSDGGNGNRCEKAKSDARRRYRTLMGKRLPSIYLVGLEGQMWIITILPPKCRTL